MLILVFVEFYAKYLTFQTNRQKKLIEIENYQKQRTRKEKKLRGLYVLTFDNGYITFFFVRF